MDERKRSRAVFVTPRQKKKLAEFVSKHPQLISCRVTPDFTYKDSQRLWQIITNECNSMGGARKTWKQWRKTWQDLRSKLKKRQEDINGDIPSSVTMLTSAEQEALGLKNVSSTTSYQEQPEFVPLVQDSLQDSNFALEFESTASLSEPESLPEPKVFTRSERKAGKMKPSTKHSSKQANNFEFNCELLALQEEKKVLLKEDYLNFKKDYLRQKLKLIKEQTEALKTIAKELCEK